MDRAAFSEYLQAVWRHWVAVVSGVIATFFGLVFDQPGWWLAATGIAALFYAQYRAYRDVRGERDEALRAAVTPALYLKAEPAFCVPLKESANQVALVLDIRVTNRESDRRVNLTFDLGLVIDFPKVDRSITMRLFPTRESTDRKYEDDLLPAVLEMDPGTTRTGNLSFDYHSPDPAEDRSILFRPWGGEGSDLPAIFEARENHRLVLAVHDHVSGRSFDLNVPGELTTPA